MPTRNGSSSSNSLKSDLGGGKIIAKNQLVGTGDGFSQFRNLVEDENGKRTSVPTSKPFVMEDQAYKTTKERREKGKYPSNDELFEKFKLNK